MKVLVTGGEGFIGKGLDAMINTKNEKYDILAYDLKSGNDVRDYARLRSAVMFFCPDVIVHLAALVHDLESIDRPQEYFSTNVMGTINVLEVAREFKVSKVIFTSSAGVLDAKTPYAFSKEIAEQCCALYAGLFGTKVCILRLFNVYGPRNDKGVIYEFMKSIKANKAVTIHNDGRYVRDYIHVSDVADVIIDCIDGKIDEGIHEVGTGEATSVNQIVRLLSSITKKKLKIKYKKVPDVIRCSVAKNTIVKKHIPLTVGLKHTWSMLA